MYQTPNIYYLKLEKVVSPTWNKSYVTLSIPDEFQHAPYLHFRFVNEDFNENVTIHWTTFNFSAKRVTMKINRRIFETQVGKYIAMLQMYYNMDEAPAA